jgi:hypothetical protein
MNAMNAVELMLFMNDDINVDRSMPGRSYVLRSIKHNLACDDAPAREALSQLSWMPPEQIPSASSFRHWQLFFVPHGSKIDLVAYQPLLTLEDAAIELVLLTNMLMMTAGERSGNLRWMIGQLTKHSMIHLPGDRNRSMYAR